MPEPEPEVAPARVAIVIPAYNAGETLGRVLDGVLAAAGGQGVTDVLVVDAGSDDSTSEVARAAGVRVLRLPRREGPARARNEGAIATDAELLLFIDSDCVPHADVVERVRAAFTVDPGLASVTGSYDAAPPDPGFFSQYMNLRHHFTHRVARSDRAGFWAGCGAVRRTAFLAAGGFDAERYPRPMIEDIELGIRLSPHGRTARDPALQVTHLKRWTLGSVVRTDITARAIPWSRLILERGEMPDDLNLRSSQRIAAALAPLVLLSLSALPVALLPLLPGLPGLPSLPGLLLPSLLLPAVASLVLHAPMLRCFSAIRGPAFALAAWAFHQVHLCYSAATLATCWLDQVWRRSTRRL